MWACCCFIFSYSLLLPNRTVCSSKVMGNNSLKINELLYKYENLSPFPLGERQGKGVSPNHLSMPFNTAGMYLGSVTSEREPQVAIYGPGK